METQERIIQNGKAFTVKTRFSRETSVGIDIKAEPAIIWALLTKASDYPRWSSTIISIEGKIALGEKIKIKSSLAPTRTFNLKVKEFVPEKRLVNGDGKGNRVYTLIDKGNGITNFTMNEKIGGLMFPLYAKYIPSFDQSFDDFANDLKNEAEKIKNTK